MSITWKTIDAWRAAREMQISDLARKAGIPERTIYAGVASDSKLRASTVSVMRQVFPEEFREAAE